jgi:hypothetical protein
VRAHRQETRWTTDQLTPPEDWVTDPEPGYDAPCPACSALVENRAVHRAWHRALESKIDRAMAEAKRYKPAPTYG